MAVSVKKKSGENKLEIVHHEVQTGLNELIDGDFDGLVNLIKHFFSSFLRIKPAFTYEEAIHEIKRRTTLKSESIHKTELFFSKLSDTEFSGGEISLATFLNFKQAFSVIISELTKTAVMKQENRKKASEMSSYAQSSLSKVADIIKLKLITHAKKHNIADSGDKKVSAKVHEILEEIAVLDSTQQMNKIKKKYHELLVYYNVLSVSEKKEFFYQVQDIYSKITKSKQKRVELEGALKKAHNEINTTDVTALKRQYLGLYKKYVQLPPSERKKIYEELKKLREKLRNLP